MILSNQKYPISYSENRVKGVGMANGQNGQNGQNG